MPRKRFKTEEIIQKLREAEVLLSQGRNVPEACRQIGVTDNTYHPGNSKRHPLKTADGSVVREDSAARGASHRGGGKRRNQIRAAPVREHVLLLDARYSGLVYIPATVVGPPHSRLV